MAADSRVQSGSGALEVLQRRIRLEGLGEALTGADVVVIPAGVPRKPGMTRDDLFNTNVSMQRSNC